MYLEEVFLYADLTPPDQLAFAKALQICLRAFKKKRMLVFAASQSPSLRWVHHC